MQTAQHAQIIFKFFHADCIKSKRFSSKVHFMPHLFSKFLSISWPKIEIVANFRQIG